MGLFAAYEERKQAAAGDIGPIGWQLYSRCSFVFVELKLQGRVMPKNIVVYSDGTGQDGGVRPEQRISNVYKVYRATRIHPDNAIDPSQQVCFYDPGLGTDVGATALTAPVRFVQKLLASVTGRGITRNIAECYEFIINHFEEGDRIFLIGFSRGAYTVRSLANLLMLCGVPTSDAGAPLFRFRKRTRDVAREAVDTVLEHGAGYPRAEFEDERFEMARRFRADMDLTARRAPGILMSPPISLACSTLSRRSARGACGVFLSRQGLRSSLLSASPCRFHCLRRQ